jgi:hypothetical protein
MPDLPNLTPTTRTRPDRWSGRKTLVFIIVASALLWALIALVIHILR